jgi:hypothetical protein
MKEAIGCLVMINIGNLASQSPENSVRVPSRIWYDEVMGSHRFCPEMKRFAWEAKGQNAFSDFRPKN